MTKYQQEEAFVERTVSLELIERLKRKLTEIRGRSARDVDEGGKLAPIKRSGVDTAGVRRARQVGAGSGSVRKAGPAGEVVLSREEG